MAEIVRMPKLSDTMEEGVVAVWHKQIGDSVESGELLADIETDKATMEFESFQDGVLLHIGVEAGKAAPVDSILAILGEKGEDVSALLAAEESAPAQPAAEPEAPQAAPAPVAAPAPEVKAAPVAAAAPAPLVASTNGRVKASPLAKKMAEEKGIDLNTLAGTGEGGRIVKRDIDNYQPVAAPVAGTAILGQESFHEEPVSQMRKTIARRLSDSKFTAPHFYLTMEIDMDQAIQARKAINASIEGKVSFNDLVIKAVSMALKKHPAVNSSWQETSIRYNDHVHIGVAVAVSEGLLVPVVRFADSKPLTQISAEVRDMAQRAKDKKLQPEEWAGNTFTISNLGMYGIEEFTAIVNPPDSCIMAVGGIREVPVVKDGQIVPGNRMKVTLSCDHRVVDGATGSEFLLSFKQFLENPVTMLA
ncbi:pyruvate dehydrogenase complex dihydrolipoamide acetyltransferase [bacterium SCSIO 12741]|nr:pyruvate dehydrogenase complex dihydrolipoamide acetyltransferase [bacterium SCSIO 12741]